MLKLLFKAFKFEGILGLLTPSIEAQLQQRNSQSFALTSAHVVDGTLHNQTWQTIISRPSKPKVILTNSK